LFQLLLSSNVPHHSEANILFNTEQANFRERDDDLPPLPKVAYLLPFSSRYLSILDVIDWVDEALSVAYNEIRWVEYVGMRAYLIHTGIISRLVIGLQNIRHWRTI
jgi:hypothetical protein